MYSKLSILLLALFIIAVQSSPEANLYGFRKTDVLDEDTGITRTIKVLAGETKYLNDGQYEECVVVGRIFVDNLDKNRPPQGLSDAKLIFCRSPTECAIFSTDQDGYYVIDLPPRDYIFKFACPPGYLLSRPVCANPRDIFFECQTIPECSCRRPASLRGLVFEDKNQDNIHNVGETPIEGILISLLPDSIAAYTNSDGIYQFTNLAPGVNYTLKMHSPDAGYRFVLPPGYPRGDLNIPPIREIDVFLREGEVKEIDQGMYRLASITGSVWDDENADGVLQPGEPLLPGVPVRLYSARNNVVIATQNSDSKGQYLFRNLEPGEYYVQFDAVGEHKHTPRFKH